jgi:hypothetical protein
MNRHSNCQQLAREDKAIVVLAFRNGPIEDLHAGKSCPPCARQPGYIHITDDEMKRIMKNAVDHVYALLRLKEESPEEYESRLRFADRYTTRWDNPGLQEGEMREVNRSAIVVTPKRPFLDWLHSVDLSSSELTLEDLREEPSVYLVPECESDEEFARWLQKMFPVIFEDQLAGWWTDEAAWPAHRTLDLFQEWFDCRFHSMVFDLHDEPLIAEQLRGDDRG